MSYEHSHGCYCESCFQLQCHRDAEAEAELEQQVSANPDEALATHYSDQTIHSADGKSWQLTKNPLSAQLTHESPPFFPGTNLKVTDADGQSKEWSRNGFISRDARGQVRVAFGNIDELKGEAADQPTQRSLATKSYLSIDSDRKLESIRKLTRQEFYDRVERPGCSAQETAALKAMLVQFNAIFDYLEATQ